MVGFDQNLENEFKEVIQELEASKYKGVALKSYLFCDDQLKDCENDDVCDQDDRAFFNTAIYAGVPYDRVYTVDPMEMPSVIKIQLQCNGRHERY